MIEDDVVVHELAVRASRDAVFAMFVEPDQLVRWIGITAELEPRPGGTFRFEVFPDEYCEGTYVEVVPPERVSMTWGWTTASMRLPPGSSRVDVVLTEVEGGTHVRLEHHSLPGDLRAMHDDGWATFLAKLSEEMR